MPDFDYSVVRSARRSLGITVKEGKVVVRVPFGLSEAQILMFVERQSGWIEKKLGEQQKELSAYDSVRNYRTVLILGTEKKLFVGCRKNSESDGVLCLKSLSELRGWTEKKYSDLIYEEMYRAGKETGALPSDLQVRDFKAKWGSCDARAVIKINWRVLFLRGELRRYICVHELCHLKFLDHSARFWKEVSKYCPNYKILRKELKSMSFLTELYRNL